MTVRRYIRVWWARFATATAYFTRWQLPGAGTFRTARLQRAQALLPWVGLLIGAIGAAALVLAAQLWPPAVAALAALAVQVYSTRALHEDGLADACDGLGGGYDTMRVLAIMHDARIGAFGAIALFFALALQWAAISALLIQAGATLTAGAWVTLAALSRFVVLLPLQRWNYLRAQGASKARVFVERRLGAGDMALAAMPLMVGWILPAPLLVGMWLGVGLALGWWWRVMKRLGGYTGDVLGALQLSASVAGWMGLLGAWNFI